MKPRPSPSAPSPAGRHDTVLDWARGIGAGDALAAEAGRIVARRRRRRLMLAGAACAVMLAGGAAWLGFRPAVPLSKAAVAVLRPELRTLADGTVVELNAGAEIAVAFAPAERRVTLRRGEAHFAVAKNPARPFVVVAGEAEVRAVGTAFAVGVATDGIDVVVTEGRVTVRANEIPVAPVLEAGGRVQLGGVAPARLSTLSPDEVRARLAWRVPRLHFAATPLARAVEMFNDHAAATGGPRLALAEPALGAVQVSGVLRADDHESLLRLLAGEFGIKAEPRGDEIVLRRQP